MIRLTDEEIEAIIRKRFCLFELDEEGEEDRKESLHSLLKAQLKKFIPYIEDLLSMSTEVRDRSLKMLIQSLLGEVKE